MFIPQHRHRDPAAVVRIVTGVALVQEVQVLELVAGRAVALVEGPAMLAHQPADHRHIDQVLKALELTQDQGAVGPGAGERYIQVVTAGLRGGQGVAPLRAFALESAVCAAFIPLVMPASVDQQAHAELLGDSF
ncbi:hypothetical protein D3C81_727110 [compost metagenome]